MQLEHTAKLVDLNTRNQPHKHNIMSTPSQAHPNDELINSDLLAFVNSL